MKKCYLLLFSLPLMLLFTGCPVDTKYPLGNPGTEKIDKKLIGDWANTESDPEAKKASVKMADDFSYDVEVSETGSMYSPATTTFKAWITSLEGKFFVYLKPKDEDKYYLYCYEVNKSTLSTWDVGLKVGGLDAVTSTQAFRDEVKASLKNPECLSGKIDWTKQ